MKLQDMAQTEAWKGGTMLPVGNHTVVIQDASERLSSNDNPQFELEFGNDAGSIRDWLVYTPATAGKVRQLLDAVGIPAQEGEMEVSAEQLIGRRLSIRVIEEPDQREPGKMRRRVGVYEPAASNGDPVPDTEDLPF